MTAFWHYRLSNCIHRESWENFTSNRRNLEVTCTDICLHNLFLAVEDVRKQYKCLKHITNTGEVLCHLWLGRIWVCKLHLHQQGSEERNITISALNKAPWVLKSDCHRDIQQYRNAVTRQNSSLVGFNKLFIQPVFHFFVPTLRKCPGSWQFTLNDMEVVCLLLPYSIAKKAKTFIHQRVPLPHDQYNDNGSVQTTHLSKVFAVFWGWRIEAQSDVL